MTGRRTRTMRMRSSLDAKLCAAAKDNGRSISEEIEYRLEESEWRLTNGVARVTEYGPMEKRKHEQP